jgi:hypothetical protein
VSRAARAARGDARLAPADRAALGEPYAGRAVDLLSRARKAGYFANPHKLAALNREPDFDALRSRVDFQALRAALMD